MVTSLVITLVSTLLVWGLLSYLIGVETARNQRLVLSGQRAKLDYVVRHGVAVGTAIVRYVDRHVIRLSWYYSLHSLLQAALRVVVSLYDYLEATFHHNRKRARAIRAERRVAKEPGGMLHSVALHKETIALSPTQKKKLRTKKLERE